ncbi:MAG: HAMP domain-containing protein [Chloroflexi bacterium]|nr:HAMP domain-containing protein [Chloroflexota bacterium]
MRTLRKYWLNLPLASKTASLTSLLVTLTVLALTYVSIQRERSSFRQELIEQADLFLETTSLTLRDPLYRLQVDELLDLARLISDNPDVNSFVVYDSKGRALVDSRQTEALFSQQTDPLGGMLITYDPAGMYIKWEAEQVSTGRVIILGNQVLGAVSADFSTKPLASKISSITQQGILLAALTLLFGAALTFLFSGQITRPLTELTGIVSRMSAGDLTQRTSYLSGDEIGRLGKAFNQMAEQLQEREWLRDMFGRFVSHEVAEAIRTGQVKLEGENRSVSVLFCDIREFTSFSENHTPQEIVTLLNEFFPIVVQSAQKHNGMVNKFGGDSTLIVYGAPREVEDSAYQAVLTALEVRAAIKELNIQLEKEGKPPLRVGVGINTGVALAGAIGPNERQEYTVVGRTVNLAARIDGLNKQFPQYDILISGWTYMALGKNSERLHTKHLGAVPITGMRDPVEIWAVIDKL